MTEATTPEPIKKRNWPRLVLKLALFVLLGYAVLLAAGLLVYQRKMMYFPQPYIFKVPDQLAPWKITPIEFETENGRQVSFSLEYLKPEELPEPEEEKPVRVWVMFHGNASLALDWGLVHLEYFKPESETRFLLVEYPGYGESQGSPDRASLIENGQRALEQFLEDENLDIENVRLGVVGYSMGAAAGLEFATRQPVDRVMLFAPYTSMLDMAKRAAPWPHYYLALDRYENRDRIRELAAKNSPPQITIFHGAADQVIPVAMGRELATIAPAITTYSEAPGTEHGNIIEAFVNEFREELRE